MPMSIGQCQSGYQYTADGSSWIHGGIFTFPLYRPQSHQRHHTLLELLLHHQQLPHTHIHLSDRIHHRHLTPLKPQVMVNGFTYLTWTRVHLFCYTKLINQSSIFFPPVISICLLFPPVLLSCFFLYLASN